MQEAKGVVAGRRLFARFTQYLALCAHAGVDSTARQTEISRTSLAGPRYRMYLYCYVARTLLLSAPDLSAADMHPTLRFITKETRRHACRP